MSPRCHLCACHRHCLFVVVMCCILVVSLFHVGATLSSSLRVLSSPRHCRAHMSSLHVLVVSFLCHGLLILCLSHLSRRCPCPSCIIVVPRCRSVIMLCVSRVGWDERGGGTHWGASSLLVSVCGCWPLFVFVFGCSLSSGVALVVVVARDVALPCHRWLFHCWLCAVVVGG